jgi:predicted CoA-binding protein
LNKSDLLRKFSRWAVIGVTENTEKYGYKIYRRLKDLNYDVYGISPKYESIEGDKVYSSLEELPVKPDVAVFVVSAEHGIEYVKKCLELGISKIWLQPGTVSFELLRCAGECGIDVFQGCVLAETDK